MTLTVCVSVCGLRKSLCVFMCLHTAVADSVLVRKVIMDGDNEVCTMSYK